MELNKISTSALIRELSDREDKQYDEINWPHLVQKMIEKSARHHAGPTIMNSFGRNEAIKKIITILNNIQYRACVSENYTITYTTK